MTVDLDVTPAQRTQLLGTQISVDPRTGFRGHAIDLGAGVDHARAQHVWETLLRTRANLRVRFVDDGDRVRQRVRAFADLPERCRRLPARNEAGATVPDHFPEVPDVFGDTPVMASFARADDGRGRLFLHLHHALVDEHSLALLGEEARRVVGGHAGADDTDAYVRAAHALSDAASGDGESEREYWRRQLVRPEPFTALVDGTADQDPPESESLRLELAAATVAGIHATARALRVTPTILAQAALVVVNQRARPGTVVPVGIPLSLRDHVDVGFDAVGLYLNVLPSVTAAADEDTLAEIVRRVRSNVLELNRHKYVPLWRIPELAGLPRSRVTFAATSYFGTTLALRHDSGGADRVLPGGALPAQAMHVDVTLGSEHGTLDLFQHASTGSRAQGAALLDAFAAVLAALGGDTAARVAEVDGVAPTVARTPRSPVTAPVRDEGLAATIATAVRDVVGYDVGRDTDVFDAGVSSVSAARVVASLRTAGLPVKVRDVFAHPTVNRLAGLVASRVRVGSGS
ncbi:condensation domain-containing protein [Actinophytocola oryzae]|uniref:Phosphopantetheine binding protein n=1 Tax=Actinophytocola oryzae TaxID=502181 RepID=A0A4R7VH74_9PSEU|nr:condensation domain-containing protein [Actinophytocola oryzae]TDV48684.1 phosphopantetheine binding protein [Actinophytocola oryzae]